MTIFFSSLLTIYSQISTLILGFIILVISIRLIKRTLLEGKEALTEIKKTEINKYIK